MIAAAATISSAAADNNEPGTTVPTEKIMRYAVEPRTQHGDKLNCARCHAERRRAKFAPHDDRLQRRHVPDGMFRPKPNQFRVPVSFRAPRWVEPRSHETTVET